MPASQPDRPTRHARRPLLGLECIVAGRAVVLARTAVERVVDYAVSPLPLARPCVAGVAAHGEQLVLSVRLEPVLAGLDGTRRRTRAVLLTSRSEGQTRWGVEIDEVVASVVIEVSWTGARVQPDMPWLGRAFTSTAWGSRELVWLDADRLVRGLEVGW